jgi:hypothetical protein
MGDLRSTSRQGRGLCSVRFLSYRRRRRKRILRAGTWIAHRVRSRTLAISCPTRRYGLGSPRVHLAFRSPSSSCVLPLREVAANESNSPLFELIKTPCDDRDSEPADPMSQHRCRYQSRPCSVFHPCNCCDGRCILAS